MAATDDDGPERFLSTSSQAVCVESGRRAVEPTTTGVSTLELLSVRAEASWRDPVAATWRCAAARLHGWSPRCAPLPTLNSLLRKVNRGASTPQACTRDVRAPTQSQPRCKDDMT